MIGIARSAHELMQWGTQSTRSDLLGRGAAPYRCALPSGRCSSRLTRPRRPHSAHVDGCSCHTCQCESWTAHGQLVALHQPTRTADTRWWCLDQRERCVLVPRGARSPLSGHQQTCVHCIFLCPRWTLGFIGAPQSGLGQLMGLNMRPS